MIDISRCLPKHTQLIWIICAGLSLSVNSSVGARGDDEWAAWRGPNQDGTINDGAALTGDAIGLEILWSQEVGQGYSGVSIANGRTLTMHTDGVDDWLTAFDAMTGVEQWRYRLGPMYQGHDGGHDGPVSTPVISDETVFALGADGRITAVNLIDGKAQWSVSLPETVGARIPFWGFASTPIVIDDVVVVQTGSGGDRSLCAFDRYDGTLRWSTGNGAVDYQSPVLAEFHGRQQLLVTTRSETYGVDPTDGSTLWSFSFNASSATTPVPVGNDRFLLQGGSGAALYGISGIDRGPKRLWRTSEFRSNYAAPVYVNGYIYGYSGMYLVCVDAKTGKRRWRSRPPGGKGVIAVNDRLVLFGAKGYVVVADANPDSYRELARIKVSDADGYSWPSFADGVIYVRNLKDLVAVRATGTATTVERSVDFSANKFTAFIDRLSRSPQKKTMIDKFMASHASFPIVEDGRLVHFVFRGDVTDVGILGNMLAQGEEDALYRVDGTNFFYRSYPIEPGARWEYQFKINLDRVRPDPLNPRLVRLCEQRGQPISEVVTPEWRRSPFEKPFEGAPRGDYDSFTLRTRSVGGSRDVRVYLPPDYRSRSERRYPLVVVNGGRAWLNEGMLPNTLNHLAAQGMDMPLVVFMAATSRESYRELGGAGTQSYVNMLVRDLMPELDRRYRIRPGASQRIIFGRRSGAVAAVYAALQYPEVFGQCIAISYGRADTVRQKKINEFMRACSDERPRVYLAWNRYEIWRPQSFDVRDQSMRLARDLKDLGFDVVDTERLDGAGWGSWRAQAGQAFQALLMTTP